MFRSILVPLDGSPFAEHSLPMAISLARCSKARLHLVTVSTPLPEVFVEGLAYDISQLQQDQGERFGTYISSVAQQVRAVSDVAVHTTVLYGEVASSLCDLIATGGEDLIVMATHGKGPLGRFWLGSVTDEMIRHAPLPLLIVRPREEKVDFHRDVKLQRIVLALNGTPEAEQILSPLLSLCEGNSEPRQIVLMQAIYPVVKHNSMPDAKEVRKESSHLFDQVQELQDHLEQQARTYLDKVAGQLRDKGLNVSVEVVAEQPAAQAILHEAEKEHADLIALETHGRGGVSRLLFGSVADKVIRGAHIPVLLHRPKRK